MSHPHNDGSHADSAGVPWEGRQFQANPNAGDDGSADPAFDAALRGFRVGTATQQDVLRTLGEARVLVPLVAEKGEEGVAPSGLAVDKTQELSLVTVAAPDGRTVLPVFSSVQALSKWDPKARPIPVSGLRAAVSAASDGTDLIVIDPTSETEFVVRRPAVWALAQGQQWIPSPESPTVLQALRESIASEAAVVDVSVSAGDPQALLRGAELVITLHLVAGLDQAALNELLQRLSAVWAADERIAAAADSMSVSLRQA